MLFAEKTFRFSHRSLVRENKVNLWKGALCLLTVDAIVFVCPYLVKLAIDALQGNPLPAWVPDLYRNLPTGWLLASLCLFYLVASALIAYGRYWWRVHLIWSSLPLIHGVRMKFFSHIQNMPRDFFKMRKVGDLISALTTDSENMRMTVSIGALMVIDTAINFVFYPIVLWMVSPLLTLVTIPWLIGISLMMLRWSDRLSGYYSKVQEVTGNLSARAFEIASGLRVIKSFGREKEIHDSFVRDSEGLRDASLKVAKYQSLFMPGLVFALDTAMVVALVVGGWMALEGSLMLSSLVAFHLYLQNMDWPMMALGWFIQLLRQSKASNSRMNSVTMISNPHLRVIDQDVANASDEAVFEIRDLTYQYEDASQPIFEKLNLVLPRGQWIGLTGPVGSGKSTLLELLSRQRDPQHGSVIFEGRDLRSYSYDKVPEQILYVPQEPFIFSRSVRENLLLGLRERRSDDDLLKLLEALCFDLKDLTERGGLDIRLGERGVNLSGGQRQRLSLGRALIRNRKAYLLDDLFSHVDSETERNLIRELKNWLQLPASILMVSQRLETLLECHQILVLKEGKIEFFGPSKLGLERSFFLRSLQEIQRLDRREAAL